MYNFTSQAQVDLSEKRDIILLNLIKTYLQKSYINHGKISSFFTNV